MVPIEIVIYLAVLSIWGLLSIDIQSKKLLFQEENNQQLRFPDLRCPACPAHSNAVHLCI